MKSKFTSELLGTMFLVMIVFGSGIMASSLFLNNEGMALFANSIAAGAGLFVLIQSLGEISGAHLNPIVSLVEMFWGRLKRKDLFLYWCAQLLGALLGVVLIHLMFDMPVYQISTTQRTGFYLVFSEFIATFGLVCAIALAGKKSVEFAPLTIAAYITSAYWFTSSTGFVNPAITIARSFTDTFCGMAPAGIFFFISAQFAGALVAYFVLSIENEDNYNKENKKVGLV
jgi:glycerol uptake facilitator-like aquaporin